MSEQLTYALITPYSILKSRTGAIIARLLGYSRLEFVGARMFVFSDAFLDAYRRVICPPDTEPRIRRAWEQYVDRSLRQDNPRGYWPRCMLLLFRGDNAVRHLKEDVIGGFTERPTGKTITVRETYGDFIRDAKGEIVYFEPAVITCPDPELNDKHLELFARYAAPDGGLLAGRMHYEEGPPEVSLAMLKPDNFYKRSRRPGNIIDTFSLTGLRIVATRLFAMSLAQAEDFYGPLKQVFVEKLKPVVAEEVYGRLKEAFQFEFTMADAEALADRLAERNAAAEFNRIVQYMTGIDPAEVPPGADRNVSGQTKCLAMLYEGPNAIRKIREVLGSTDPSKAEPGTVRSDFGRDLMRNGAHASDSAETARRERQIVGLAEPEPQPPDIQRLIESHLARRK